MSTAPYYADEQVTLYLGDCREILPALGITADCIMADPPYAETSLAWDRWPDGWVEAAASITRSMWCFGSLRMFLRRSGEFAGWNLSQDIVWAKPRPCGMAADRFARAHELVTFWYRGAWSKVYRETQREPYYGKRTTHSNSISRVYGPSAARQLKADNGTRLMTSVLSGSAGDARHALHPTQKPAEVLMPLIGYACPPGGLIVVPFAGSGSDLDAARASGRRAIGVELYEPYAEKAARRLAQGMLAIT